MKRKNKNYYNADELLKCECDINIIDGAREIGKSTDICRRAVEKLIASNGKRGAIAYIRRKDKQMSRTFIEKYLKEEMIKKWTGGKWECIRCRGRLTGYFARVEEVTEDGEVKWVYSEFPVIYGFALVNADDFKSLNYTVDFAIYEEYQTNDYYLEDEPNKIFSLFSTLKRENENFKMFLIANTICRINPFVRSWGLVNYNKQKQGTIDTYKLYLGLFDEEGNEKYIKIAREYSALTADGTEISEARNLLKSKRNRINTMITRGEWEETRIYLTETQQYIDTLKEIYHCYIKMENACFKLTWYFDKMLFCYICPHKFFIKNENKERVISNVYIKSNKYTRYLKGITQQEQYLFSQIENNCRFSDNLTGNEFFTVLKNLKN